MTTGPISDVMYREIERALPRSSYSWRDVMMYCLGTDGTRMEGILTKFIDTHRQFVEYKSGSRDWSSRAFVFIVRVHERLTLIDVHVLISHNGKIYGQRFTINNGNLFDDHGQIMFDSNIDTIVNNLASILPPSSKL